MENLLMERPKETEADLARRVSIMRAIARLHECDAETLFSMVDASDTDIRDTLAEMVASRDVEVSSGALDGRFALTLKGWGRYMAALGSIYELTE